MYIVFCRLNALQPAMVKVDSKAKGNLTLHSLHSCMCINFCRLNTLQPAMVKVDSKVKGNLTLHSLPKIDELYTKLNGAKKISALDLTSGYYHI